MANRTNKQNRTFSRSCSVCSSSAPHRTEPNNTLVRFVFGRISNIDNLVRFCSNRTRTEQYPCSVRVRQVRTTTINFGVAIGASDFRHHLASLAITTCCSLDCEQRSIPLTNRGGIRSIGNHESNLSEILGV